MSFEVFISYRRDDASSEAGRLADTIRYRFGDDSTFMDTSDTPLGTEWPQALRNAVKNSRVLISVMGPDWILARDEYGRRRIDDPKDWVRREIELALEYGKTIMPLLVRRARMIPASALPHEIAPLSSRQALKIHAESWVHDLELVLRGLESHLDRRDTSISPFRPTIDAPPPPFTAEDFRAVVLGFDSSDVNVRRKTAGEIKNIAALLELEDVLHFCRSRKTAERVGAAIALGVHLRSSNETRRDRRVLSALGELLMDGRSSLVRYRAAEVLQGSPTLVPTYDDELRHLAETDKNSWVRRMAAKALQTAYR